MPSGKVSAGSSSSNGIEHEAAVAHLRMRQGEARRLELDLAEDQQVDVERPRPVARAQRAPALDLDRLADIEQRLGLELGADADAGVEEVGLVEDLPHRLGLVGRGDGLDLDPVTGQLGDRGAQMAGAVADVGAQPEEADLRRARLRPPRRRSRAGARG